MMPAKFLWAWEVLVDIPQFDQEPQAKNRCPVGVVDIASAILLDHHTVEGGP